MQMIEGSASPLLQRRQPSITNSGSVRRELFSAEAKACIPAPTGSSLSSLAPEIRELIWLFIFSPQTIQLHLHTSEWVARKLYQVQTKPRWQKTTQTMSVFFTATVVSPENVSFFCDAREWEEAHPETASPSPAPSALHVCRESHAIALRRYELAFAGKNLVRKPRSSGDRVAVIAAKEWAKSCWAEKKIWVDFQRDEVLLDSMWKAFSNHGTSYNLLEFVRENAKEEMGKIRRLGVRGHWTDVAALGAWRTRMYWDLVHNLPHFENLKELSVYDIEFANGSNVDWCKGKHFRDPKKLKKNIVSGLADAEIRGLDLKVRSRLQ